MNLVVIAAVIAVASAAKLDRSYLPPPSAKTAGGSPGALQTPFASNSFNQGLGGIPKGGFENDFKGVVVDAASPGTRASGAEDTGLGAPRVAYGSTNSKVGDAAFSGTPTAFQFPRQNQQSRFGNQQNQIPDGTTAGTSLDAQSFVQPGIAKAQSFAQGPGSAQAQGFIQRPGNTQGSESTYQRSQELNSRDAAASIVRFDSDVGTDSFSYSFETDNGISAEESGVATNGVQAQGAFSYTGDDGQVYSVTYTADEGGYQPKGDHLPTPPPIPEEILRSLEQNAKEEAAGLVDDGSYDAQKYNAEGDYTENDGASTHNGRQPSQFGNRPESDASASGTFINQNNQPFVRPNANGQAGQTGQAGTGPVNFGSSPQGSNTFAQAAVSTIAPNGFGQHASSLNAPNAFGQAASPSGSNSFEQAASPSNAPNTFGQSASPSRKPNGFGQANQAVNGFQQQNRPSFSAGTEDSENANTFISPTFEASQSGSSQNVIQAQNKPQQPFGKPQSNSQAFNGQNSAGSVNSNPFGPASSNGNTFGQRQPSSQTGNRFGNNEYLPPVNGNRRPTQATPQRPSSFSATQNSNQFSQSVFKPQDSSASSAASAFGSSSEANVESKNPQLGFQNNQYANNQKPASLTPSQNFAEAQSNGKPSFGGSENVPSSSQASGSFSPFKQQQSTANPVTELTTPFEDSPHSEQGNQGSQSLSFGSFNAQSSQGIPTQSPFGSKSHNKGASQFATPASTSASAFASSVSTTPQGFNSKPSGSNFEPSPQFLNQKPQSHYNQENNFGQSQSPNAFSQNQPSDVQFASSTQRPIFSQNTQSQGPDDSYYYNQPSKAFGTPFSQAQASRFPNTPFNQFNRVTQRPSFQSNVEASVSQQNIPGNSFNQNKQPQGSTRYPQPPFLSSVAPTSPTQGSTAASFNGITQASASSFASGAPTPSTQFGSQSTFSGFGRRPTQQPNGQFNNQAFSQSTSSQQSFGKQTTAIPQSFSNLNRNQQQNSFQNQQQPSNNAGGQSPTANEVPAATVKPYKGEIYEYNKPAQTLPPPTEQDVKDGFGQFGNPIKLQSGQQGKPQESSDSQSGSTQGPQVSQPFRPQFGQKTQTNQQTQFNQASSRPQFGQQPTGFGNARPTQVSSFAQSSFQKVQPTAQGNQFNSQSNLNTDSQLSQQKFGSRPFENQPSQFNGQAQQSGSQEQNPRKPCCTNNNQLPSAPQPQPQSNQFGQSQSQFGSSDVTAQGFKPDQASAQSFAGKGEVFGGPRKPPSFDEETGYHY